MNMARPGSSCRRTLERIPSAVISYPSRSFPNESEKLFSSTVISTVWRSVMSTLTFLNVLLLLPTGGAGGGTPVRSHLAGWPVRGLSLPSRPAQPEPMMKTTRGRE